MDILKNFGVDPILLAAQVVNFLIIFWLLKKFAYKPIFQMLKKRKDLIAEGVENAKRSEELLLKTEEKEKEVLRKAQATSQEILADAQKQAQDAVTSAQEEAKVKVAKMLDEAKKEIEEQTALAEKQLSKHTAVLAVDLLKKSLTGLVDKNAEKEVLSKVAKKLKA